MELVQGYLARCQRNVQQFGQVWWLNCFVEMYFKVDAGKSVAAAERLVKPENDDPSDYHSV